MYAFDVIMQCIQTVDMRQLRVCKIGQGFRAQDEGGVLLSCTCASQTDAVRCTIIHGAMVNNPQA